MHGHGVVACPSRRRAAREVAATRVAHTSKRVCPLRRARSEEEVWLLERVTDWPDDRGSALQRMLAQREARERVVEGRVACSHERALRHRAAWMGSTTGFHDDRRFARRETSLRIVHLILEHACTGQDDSSPPQGSARGDQATAQRSVRAVSVRLPVDCCAPPFLLRADAPPLAALCQHEPIRLPAQDVIAFTGMLRSSPGVEHVAIATEPYSDILIKVAKSFAKHPGAFRGQLFIEAKDFDAESFGYAAYDEAPHFLLVDTARLVVKVEVLGF